MNVSDLRVGNLILKDGGQPWEVSGLFQDSVIVVTDSVHFTLPLTEFSPIVISEDWLIKLGFEKKPMYGWRGNGYDYQPETSKTEQQDFVIWADENAFVFRIETYSWRREETDQWNSQNHTEIHFSGQYYEKISERIYTVQPVMYVHQLQNLYYALTSKPLITRVGERRNNTLK